MGNQLKITLKLKKISMRVLALVSLLFATAFAGKVRSNFASFKACQNSLEGTKLHWNCRCGVATKKAGGVMSENCKAQRQVVVDNLKQCVELRTTYADNYEMFFDADIDEEFIVESAPQPSAEEKEFFSKYC